jgi:hypothetical protein
MSEIYSSSVVPLIDIDQNKISSTSFSVNLVLYYFQTASSEESSKVWYPGLDSKNGGLLFD